MQVEASVVRRRRPSAPMLRVSQFIAGFLGAFLIALVIRAARTASAHPARGVTAEDVWANARPLTAQDADGVRSCLDAEEGVFPMVDANTSVATAANEEPTVAYEAHFLGVAFHSLIRAAKRAALAQGRVRVADAAQCPLQLFSGAADRVFLTSAVGKSGIRYVFLIDKAGCPEACEVISAIQGLQRSPEYARERRIPR